MRIRCLTLFITMMSLWVAAGCGTVQLPLTSKSYTWGKTRRPAEKIITVPEGTVLPLGTRLRFHLDKPSVVAGDTAIELYWVIHEGSWWAVDTSGFPLNTPGRTEICTLFSFSYLPVRLGSSKADFHLPPDDEYKLAVRESSFKRTCTIYNVMPKSFARVSK
ncbi:hypothetical protein KW796_00265 [Candidatus Parcubacteria bacterium]|nr:hypothetical protein [Candidatus Parcubacteria bacterium]